MLRHEDPVLSIFTVNYMVGGNTIVNNYTDILDGTTKKRATNWRNDTLIVNVGDTIHFYISTELSAEINFPPDPDFFNDNAKSTLYGYVLLSFQPIPIPPPYQPGYNPRIEFSLDIGSDAELSDPNQNGNEVFDPGDAYVMGGPFMFTPQSGVKNDATIFGADPWPIPGNPATNVPCGNGNFDPLPYFNLNGMDNMESSLYGMSYGEGLPSIPWFEDELVFPALYFLISYDDDRSENWSYQWIGAVPVNSFSPISGQTFGRTNQADEVIAIDLDNLLVPSMPVTYGYLWSEADIHPNLVPNPDTQEENDNDVNALSYFPNPLIEGYFYFTCDSEATYTDPSFGNPLNPGSIYQLISPGNFVEVVNPVTHLGLPNGTDVNAFTFGWVWDTLANRLGLALLFSVDINDWTTSLDESGGLDSRMIYYSFLNGTNAPYMSELLNDNIDAITIVPYSYNVYVAEPPVPDQYDYGDAPEDDVAYPDSGVFGSFPTCTATGPAGNYIRHAGNNELFFGPMVDYESNGNAGTCVALFNQDECFLDGDAGLIFPGAFTIYDFAGTLLPLPCPNSPVIPLGNPGSPAVWGSDIDIEIANNLSTDAYFNLLIDWNSDGVWAGLSERVVINLIIPPLYIGPLSGIIPAGSSFIIPSITIGYVWARFTLSEQPAPVIWFGSGDFDFGETEDYLLFISPAPGICDPPVMLGATTSTNNVIIDWIPVPALGYELVIMEGTNVIYFATLPVGTNNYAVSGLTPGAVHTAFLRSDCGSEKSIWESSIFVTMPAPCDPPLVFTVLSGITDALFNCVEPLPLSGVGYELQVEDLITGVVVYTTIIPVGTNTYLVSGLMPNTIYLAMIRSVCGPADYSGWEVLAFTTNPIPYDFGDAPEGEVAYLSPLTIGQFPTCVNVGPAASFIRHAGNAELYFGPSIDYEVDGNEGLCPTFSPDLYDRDECWNDGDAGLILPVPYTIVEQAGTMAIQLCDSTATSVPWKTCREAIWGLSVDIFVTNTLPGPAYFNLLVDWNQDGIWDGSSVSACPLHGAPEHAIINFPVPPGFADSLSKLTPPNFRVGPLEGYVWARFTLSEQPVTLPWKGTGIFDFGETEDYLVAVADPMLQDGVFINNTTFGAGFDDCVEAFDLIEISDSEFEPGSSFIAVAGNTVRVLPESHFKSGAYALLKIDQDGNFCSNYKGMLNVDEAIDKPSAQIPDTNEPLFRVYPNPTSGIITIELLDFDIVSISSVEIYNIMGERIHLDRLVQLPLQINLSDQKPGLYLVCIRYENGIWIKKLILH